MGTLIWIIFLFFILQPVFVQWSLRRSRANSIRKLEKRRGSRVITMIHRQETVSLLGIPIIRYIDVEDSEAVLRAIELTDDSIPIDIVLHTPGGLVLASQQIALALAAHPAPVSVIVPHYAMSGGTLIALAADNIIMSPSAVLGPVDPQIDKYPASSILNAVARKDIDEVDDETLIYADIAQKAQIQIREFVMELLLLRNLSVVNTADLTAKLTDGRWTHDFPITVTLAEANGFVISTNLPPEAREIMDLYPQPKRNSPVEYIPEPYGPRRRLRP